MLPSFSNFFGGVPCVHSTTLLPIGHPPSTAPSPATAYRRLFLVVLLLGLFGSGCQNDSDAPADAPSDSTRSAAVSPTADGMVLVPGGRTKIGIEQERWDRLRSTQDTGPRHLFGRDATPPFRADVDSFFLDRHPVTVEQFRAFVDDTGYTTQAEEFGDGGVLSNGRWRLVEGASWHHPRGPSRPEAPDDHPVTQVSWNDAQAYCEWTGKRLPTEVEWEHAARMGRDDRSLCTWGGDCLDESDRVANANTWQGQFPTQNTEADGYRYTSPVGAFDTTALDLQDMSGNVWEWTASWKRPYERRDAPLKPSEKRERVMRGGSFICDDCGGFFVFARSGNTPRTSLFQVGFRCATDPTR